MKLRRWQRLHSKAVAASGVSVKCEFLHSKYNIYAPASDKEGRVHHDDKCELIVLKLIPKNAGLPEFWFRSDKHGNALDVDAYINGGKWRVDEWLGEKDGYKGHHTVPNEQKFSFYADVIFNHKDIFRATVNIDKLFRQDYSVRKSMISGTWPTKKLGDIIELKYGKGISRHERDENGDVPIYGANGVLGRASKALASGEAIIIGRKGSAGELTRVAGRFWPSDVTYYVYGNEKINLDYLFHFLKSQNLTRLAVGVKPGINRNRVYELEIPLPPIEEQKKIADRLEKQFAKIDEVARLRAVNEEHTAALLPVVLCEIFSSHEWVEKELGEICKIQSGGTPSKAVREYWEGGDVPWLRSEACKDVPVNHADKFITRAGLENSSARLFKPRTTLIALVGATIGRTGFLTFESSTNQNIAGLYPNDEKQLLPEFLFLAVKNLYPAFLHIGKGKFKMANLSFVKSLKIPLPPLDEQKRIVNKLDATTKKICSLRDLQAKQSADLKALKQSILHEAFSGKMES